MVKKTSLMREFKRAWTELVQDNCNKNINNAIHSWCRQLSINESNEIVQYVND